VKKFTTPRQLAGKNIPYTMLIDKLLTFSEKAANNWPKISRKSLSLTRMNGKKFPI
jgi:hypothetical protein